MSGVITDSKVPGENCCWDKRTQFPVLCHVANHVLFAEGSSQKKDVMPDHQMLIKSVKNVSCVDQLSSVHNVTNVPLVAPNLPVGSRLHLFGEKWAALNVNPRVVSILREGYVLPFRSRPNLTREPTITSCYVDPHRNSYLLEALHQLLNKNAVELVLNQKSLGFYNRLFLVPKPNNRWRPILDLSNLNNFLKTQTFKMETPETIRTSLQSGEWVTSVDFKDAYFHIPINSQSRKYMHFQIQDKTYQFKALPFGLSTAPREFTMIAKEVKLLALTRGIRIHQYLDDWLVRAKSPQVCLQHTQKLLTLQRLGMAGKRREIRAGTQADFQFRRLPVRFGRGQGQTYPGTLASPNRQNPVNSVRSGLSGSTVHVPHWSPHSNRKTSSLGETTHEAHTVALEKQLEGPRVSGKGDPGSQVPPPPSKVVAGGRQCTTRSTFTRPKTCSANLYRRIKRRVGRSLRRAHCKRNLVSSREQITHKPVRAKSSIPSSKRLSNPRLQQDSVDSYRQHNSGGLYQQRGGMKSGSLCALLWRLLSWCTRQQVTLRARHIPGRLNVIADKLSRLGQTIQTEWSLHPEVFKAICNRWHQPQVDLFATRFNNKLPQFVSPVPDPRAWAVDALSLSWEDLDPYAYPPAAILGKVVEKLQDYPCNRIILIAPGWPNMPWFWDLVAMSSQIPLCLPSIPNLVSQPFNQVLHRNLSNLNLHAWLLEPQQSRSKASLRQWQHELRLLKEDQPDLSMRQSGPFLQSGASVIRWTSGHHL